MSVLVIVIAIAVVKIIIHKAFFTGSIHAHKATDTRNIEKDMGLTFIFRFTFSIPGF
jgi:hypothetical protein